MLVQFENRQTCLVAIALISLLDNISSWFLLRDYSKLFIVN